MPVVINQDTRPYAERNRVPTLNLLAILRDFAKQAKRMTESHRSCRNREERLGLDCSLFEDLTAKVKNLPWDAFQEHKVEDFGKDLDPLALKSARHGQAYIPPITGPVVGPFSTIQPVIPDLAPRGPAGDPQFVPQASRIPERAPLPEAPKGYTYVLIPEGAKVTIECTSPTLDVFGNFVRPRS